MRAPHWTPHWTPRWAPRWALALTAFATAGTAALVLGLPNSASAEDMRYNLDARGDAFYFEVNGEEIPVSPNNDAGSLTASAATTNAGGSEGFAGMPYWGNTVQYAPGTANGVPNQFGAGQVQIPFAVLPGFVVTSSSGTSEAEEDFGYGRVKSSSLPNSATSSASYGAPSTIPAPNQQQNANAATEIKANTVSAVASGSSAGFVSGPLEVANSTAIASITQTVGKAAKIESKTFGRFAVNGQEFGFDQNGFRYLGQGMSSQDALGQANEALKNAGIQIDLAPITTAKDATGKTTYSIGGLMVSTTQASPTGAGTFTVKYTLGRAKVGASVATLGFQTSDGTTAAGTENSTDSTDSSAGTSATGSSDTGASTDPATDVTSGLDAAALSPDLASAAANVPTSTSTITGDGAVASDTGGLVDLTSAQPLPKTLGFVPVAGQTGQGSEWLYAMLALAGVAIAGGRLLFSGFAVASSKA